MIILKKLKWNNFFSYGEGNEIVFDKDILTQISGINGAGKSSIVLILEEILFGKNFKNIKKGDIPNWNIPKATLFAELELLVNNIAYKIILQRRTSIKLSLYREGEDISGHTSTQTYKEIEKILGLNYKTFNQLIYQSSKSSLQFLTTTDTARKNFLVSMFGLEEYGKYLDIYKEAAKKVSSDKSILSGEAKTLSAFITKYSSMNFIKKSQKELPEEPTELIKELGLKEQDLKNITQINDARNKNNTYKELLSKINVSELTTDVRLIDTKKLLEDKTECNSIIKRNTAEIKTLKSVGSGTCPKCRQDIDEDLLTKLIEEDENEITSAKSKLKEVEEKLKEAAEAKKVHDSINKNIQEFERLSNLIDNSMETEILDSGVLSQEIKELKSKIKLINDERAKIIKENKVIAENNSRIDIVTKQLEEHRAQLSKVTNDINKLEELESNINILKKVFSNTGLIAFKLEYLTKTLEQEINNYLSILSNGQFVLEFVLESEKLNIKLTNNGKETNMVSLSSGQEARVNAATLLAIRKMMSNISGSKINLLILDEIAGVLDSAGRDTLIEVLLEENDLNTFIVDHSFSHPLLATLNVNINKGISTLEEG